LPKKLDMAEIINQIPGFEKGRVQCVFATDEEGALLLSAQMVSDLLNKWSTNVAFFSLTGRADALEGMVQNESKVARLYTVNQKNPELRVIINKAQGMVNRKFVRTVIIEGFQKLEQVPRRGLEQFALSANVPVILVGHKCTDMAETPQR
jgi:tRNA(Ile)-lysidine synthase TilS/MesJ